ncbi:alpha/beta hydrolase [Mycolicibacterium moriokaense]|uniref:Peptidase M13 n=1 Tax=Mycolicibacterium moriokaense TaxID=39691 RepID=A0AAD1HD15_9MYCO|nr:alpha/beta hydrolase [Mycolicibacterium moriokaense]MCV7038025.1 alpha/beta hydrolase [Mycolicibacterium moriokaense]ORB25917.1 alpha/beta hydrolase [Mycolicibacterium moriokaense]BBX03145.1 peptidase M13 [Mycolicibacterium moriokaense]
MVAATNLALLHGGGQGSWVWDDVMGLLSASEDIECITLDVPGCGTKRGRDTSAIEFDDIAREFISDIEAAGMRDVVLVGHSQAGMPIPRMAEFAPTLFRRLVYVSCSSPPPGTNLLELIGDGVHGEHEDKVGYPLDPATTTFEERFAVMFCNDMSAPQGEAFLAKLGADMWPMSSYTYRDWRYDHLKSVASTYVMCERDMSLPLTWQQRFAEMLWVDRVVRIDAGHQVMNTQPQTLTDALIAEAQG